MSIEQDFEAFWQAYPKRTGRVMAYRQYLAAVYYGGATSELILKGIEAYKRHLMTQQTEFQFIKSPAAWLSGGHWLDEYEINLPKAEVREDSVRIGETHSQMRRRLERRKLQVVR